MNQNNLSITWAPGVCDVAVVMISLNEGHNLRAILENLRGWAREVFLVDSFSQDETIDIALSYGINVVQRGFTNFGDQWNFALSNLPITSRWTMKLDPDERLSSEFKMNFSRAVQAEEADGFSVERRLWLMGVELPIRQRLVRVWRTGFCHFTDVSVNEHPIVNGKICDISGIIEHHDSPDLAHWIEKQNRYTTAEAIILFNRSPLAVNPKIFGSVLQRRMWLKKYFYRIPFRYLLLFFYHWLVQGAWRAGWAGYAWSRLRADVMRLVEYKFREMRLSGRVSMHRVYGPGRRDLRVRQYY